MRTPIALSAGRAHLVGTGGAGMRSLAAVLHAIGYTLSGSDLCDCANAPGQITCRGHSAENINPTLNLVVYSSAVSLDNPELVRARALGIETLSYPQMLGRLMADRTGVAVAGTHGKSTTTAMAAAILSAAGLDPAVVAGAVPLGRSSGGHFGRGEWMLVEACEYREHFLHLHPRIVLVTGIEPDHFDYFRSAEHLENAFRRFMSRVPPDGVLIGREDCPVVRRIAPSLECRFETFGLGPNADWWVAPRSHQIGNYRFDILRRGRMVCTVSLPMPGLHNVVNALGAAALAAACGAGAAAIRRGLQEFPGLRRRLERLADVHGIARIDDYAHHPTEISAALATIRQMFPGRRVWCVFQPHQASRTRSLLDALALSLQNADNLVVAEIFRAREPAQQRGDVSAADLAAKARALGARVIDVHEPAEIRRALAASLEPGDVLAALGAGDIGKIVHELD